MKDVAHRQLNARHKMAALAVGRGGHLEDNEGLYGREGSVSSRLLTADCRLLTDRVTAFLKSAWGRSSRYVFHNLGSNV
jgi:hypothetical protein